MAAHPIFISTVKFQSEELLRNAKFLCHTNDHPSQCIVTIQLEKAKAGELTRLCALVDEQARPAIEALIQKAQVKLAFAEKVNAYLSTKSESIDLRVEKLMGKITEMMERPKTDDAPTAILKLCKLQNKLNNFGSIRLNTMTTEALAKARMMLEEIEMKLLLKSPQLINLGPSVARPETLHHYDENEESQDMGSVAFAMKYLATILSVENQGIGSFFVVEEDITHYRMAQLIKGKKPEWRVSEEDTIQKFSFPNKLVTVSHPDSVLFKSPNLREYPCGATEKEIQDRLEALIELKKVLHLKTLGAFVGIGHYTLAIVFHNTSRISLYNPCGDNQSPFCYEVSFGSTEQAAALLKELTGELNRDIPPITLKPYCDWDTFILGKWEMEGKQGNRPSGTALGLRLPFSFPPSATARAPSSISSYPPQSGLLPLTDPAFLHPSPVPYVSNAPIHISAPDSLTLENNDGEELDDVWKLGKICPALVALHDASVGLSWRNSDGHIQGLSHLDNLKNVKWQNSESTVRDRVFFHLYQIQNIETPDKVDRNDRNWGMNAFQTEELSTPEQKRRAVQRTQVELLLSLIDRPIDNESTRLLFDALEALKMHANDLPKGQDNPAHALFGKLYENYVEERKQNRSLEDPQHEKFRGDFGRNVFRGDVDAEVPFAVKSKALQEVAQAFQAAWRI